MSGLLAGLPQAYARAWHAANPLQHGGTGLCSKRLHDDAVRTIAMTLQLSNFPHDYVWPDDDLSVIPDWVYTDQAIYEREVERHIVPGRAVEDALDFALVDRLI